MTRWMLMLGAVLMASLPMAPARAETAYDFEMTSIDGTPLKFEAWRGKPLLIVNTASFCGFTKQYAGLQDLWSRYQKDGLVVVGIPSNDFGGQEPKAEGEIKSFCQGAFGVTFPLTSKVAVTGPSAHPLYAWLAKSPAAKGPPQWNFHKYLIDRNGRVAGGFSSAVEPGSAELKGAIEAVLKAAP